MQRGEIYALGNHRLMCGDATNRDDVMRLIGNEHVNLVLTDPPYGYRVQHKGGNIGGEEKRVLTMKNNTKSRAARAYKYSKLIGDESTSSARKHYAIVKELANKLIFWGGQCFTNFLPSNPAWLFWDKNTGSNDFADGELAWCSFGKRIRKYKQTWNGVCMEGSYRLNGREKRARMHPTQKPVELHMKILEDFTQPDDYILDCFGGSGTTLIACEMTQRKCLMMEISPEYCNIIIERYEKLLPMMKAERIA